MLRGRFVGGGKRLLPLGVIEQILLLVQLRSQGFVAFGSFGLFLQLFHLTRQLVLQIAQTLQMLARVFQTAFRLLAAFLIFGHARRLLDISAQLLRPRFDDARNHPLLDNSITACAHARTQEQISNIAAAHGLIVDEISRFALTCQLPLDAYLSILPPRPLQTVVAVVKHQLHRSPRRRTARCRTVKNHVLHTLAAKLLRRSLTQHPAHRINHIRLAAAVRSDNRNKLPRHMNRGRVGKRFKAGEFNVGQAHGNVSNRTRRRILTEIRLSVERKSDNSNQIKRPSEVSNGLLFFSLNYTDTAALMCGCGS